MTGTIDAAHAFHSYYFHINEERHAQCLCRRGLFDDADGAARAVPPGHLGARRGRQSGALRVSANASPSLESSPAPTTAPTEFPSLACTHNTTHVIYTPSSSTAISISNASANMDTDMNTTLICADGA